MSFSILVQETLQNEYEGKKTKDYDYKSIYKERLIGYRRTPEAIVRVEKPTNIPRARSLGYKAKKGFVVARVRIRKGSGLHRKPTRGRKPRRMGVMKLTRRTSVQAMAERRAGKKYKNLEVLNSYWVGEDGMNKYFEIIMVDPQAPEIKADKEINWITESQHTRRAERGLTSAGSKARGRKARGKGSEKTRPSIRAKGRQGK